MLVKQISNDEVLAIYMASTGIVSLAMERIQANYPDFTEIDLHRVLSSPSILSQLEAAARASIIRQTYEAAIMAIANMKVKLPNMAPFEAAKTATNLIEKLESLTRPNADTNINTFIWENVLPAEAVEAVKFLQARRVNANN